jgi:hypothetical protein
MLAIINTATSLTNKTSRLKKGENTQVGLKESQCQIKECKKSGRINPILPNQRLDTTLKSQSLKDVYM